MTLLICLPLILIAGGLTVRRWFAASRQDIRSIESHRSSLDLLEHLAPGHGGPVGGVEPGSAHVRVVGSSGVSAVSAVRPMAWGRVDGRPPAARPSWHAPREDPLPSRFERARQMAQHAALDDAPRIVITDDSVVGIPDPVVGIPDPEPAFPAPPEPVRPNVVIDALSGEDHPAVDPADSINSLDNRSEEGGGGTGRPTPMTPPHGRARVVLALAAGLLVVAGGAGVAVTELHPFSHTSSHQASSGTPGPSGAGGGRSGGPAPAAAPTTTPTASSVPPALTATSSTSTDAIYTVTGGQLQLSLTASGPCWVELRSGSPTGPVVYEGTIQAGSSQDFSAGGGAWLRLGDPGGVQLRINGSPVQLPSVANPFNVTVSTA